MVREEIERGLRFSGHFLHRVKKLETGGRGVVDLHLVHICWLIGGWLIPTEIERVMPRHTTGSSQGDIRAPHRRSSYMFHQPVYVGSISGACAVNSTMRASASCQ